MTSERRVDIDRVFRERVLVDRALAIAGREAAIRHKALGIPLVVWENGQVVRIPPEEIVVPVESPDDVPIPLLDE
jgi:hypothetical protein